MNWTTKGVAALATGITLFCGMGTVTAMALTGHHTTTPAAAAAGARPPKASPPARPAKAPASSIHNGPTYNGPVTIINQAPQPGSTVYVPVPAYAPAYVTTNQGVVQQYYDYLNNKDFQSAWNLGGRYIGGSDYSGLGGRVLDHLLGHPEHLGLLPRLQRRGRDHHRDPDRRLGADLLRLVHRQQRRHHQRLDHPGQRRQRLRRGPGRRAPVRRQRRVRERGHHRRVRAGHQAGLRGRRVLEPARDLPVLRLQPGHKPELPDDVQLGRRPGRGHGRQRRAGPVQPLITMTS